MKKIFLLAALALTMAACSNEDNITEQPAEVRGIPFSATITTGGATRALSGPDNTTKVITATWAENEEVALVYEVGGETKVTKATVSAVSDGTDGKTVGTATITATLDANVTNGTNVTLIYPYSMVETSGTNIGKLKDNAFTGQNGALTGDGSISKNYDLRQGKGKIYYNGTDAATLKDNVAMASQIAIWKLTTKKDLGSGSSEDLSVTKFSAFANGYSAQATFTSTANVFYLAVPAGTSGLTFLATGANASTTYIYNKASVTLNASTYYESTVTLTQQNTRTISDTDGEVELKDGDVVSGTGGTNTKLFIADKATVTLNGLTNNSITSSLKQAGIKCLGDATIILADGTTNTLKGRYEMPAIFIPEGKTLTIRGGGTLIADNTGAGTNAAGIGGGDEPCGNIVIEGGTITAKASYGAGIGGGGNGKSCGTITISGGTITATGDGFAAGIGSGDSGTCGDIAIRGGTVTATGGGHAAGIGSGTNGTCVNITISGGTVTATGGDYAAGIGSGEAYNASITCGDITISGGTITATGGVHAAGIGSGYGGEDEYDNPYVSSCGAITISSGTVKATGGNGAAGIGSGVKGKFKSITIGSSITSVTATRSNDDSNVPIGKGDNDQGSGSITIDDETISDAMTGGTAALPAFTNLKVEITDGASFTNGTWTITKK